MTGPLVLFILKKMHRSWKYLTVKNEEELVDLKRLRRLSRHRGIPGMASVIAFAVLALACLLMGAFFSIFSFRTEMSRESSLGTGLMLLLMSGVFLFAARLFYREWRQDLLRDYLLHPEEYEIVRGLLSSFSFVVGDRQKLSRFHVEGEVVTSAGTRVPALEFFAAEIWPFTTVEADSQLTPDDDWYELKGQRDALPIPAYFICTRVNPRRAALVGVDYDLIAGSLRKSRLKL